MAKAKNRSDSSQMTAILQPDFQQSSEKPQSEKECSSKNSSGPANPSSSSSSSTGNPSSSSSSSAGPSFKVGNGAEAHKPAKKEREEATSSCCQLQDLRKLPQCDIKLGHLDFGRGHTVLVDVQSFNFAKALIPQEGGDKWNRDYVKMPCSPSSTAVPTTSFRFMGFPVKGPDPMRRWELISKELEALASKPAVSADKVQEAILKYNPNYTGRWSFDALTSFVKCIPKSENFFDTVFPKIAALALKLPKEIQKPIPLLQRGHPAAITLSQRQISCLLANAFFCTFPHRNASHPNSEYHNYPSINFSSLFGNCSDRKKQKLRAIMYYFKVMTENPPEGLVTFERRRLNTKDTNWRSCEEKLHKLHVSSQGSIETEGTGMLQVDFAACLIGGGVLGNGLVQEEILFLINPELIVSRLFTEKLNDDECLIITGSQQFSNYLGFSDSFKWMGPHEDQTERDDWARRQRQILAIDAVHYKQSREQYSMRSITRELNKAYCGFKGQRGHEEPDIATGKWGCGAFNGDPQLKAIIQLMAAAKARRGLAFFTFGDEALKRELEQIYHLLVTEGTTVGELYSLLEDYCEELRRARAFERLFKFIKRSNKPSISYL